MKPISRLVHFISENSLLLIFGTAAGLAWANLHSASYLAFRDALIPLPRLSVLPAGITLHDFVNDILMAFFFAIAAKEVWAAMLPGGPLNHFRRAATPVLCAVGGMTAPALIYVAGSILVGQFATLGRGWAIPCATDVAFSFLIARAVFGRHHPAVPFLLLLAIADDALGLIVLAAFYPIAPVSPLWLLGSLGAVLLSLALRNRRVHSFWWYILIPGTISWISFALSGLHPALGLLPIIPTLPHGRTVESQVHWGATLKHNTLDEFESWWSRPVEVILGLFAMLNAGVAFSALGIPTYLVVVALVVGKPIGIFCTGILSTRGLGFLLPEGLTKRELLVVGCAAGIGFTVALFVCTVAFHPGPVQDAAKMGALASALACLTTVLVARIVKMRPR